MADIKIADLNLGTVLGADDAVVLVQGDTTLQVKGQDIAWGVKTLADLADKAYVDAIVAGAPELLDTLNELAAAIGDDPNFSSSIKTILDSKLPTVNFGLEFWNALTGVNTYHIAEGSNLYYTENRVDANFATKTTSALTEGSNLYFTEQRVLDVVTPLIPTSVFDLDVPEVSVNLPGYLHYDGETLSWQLGGAMSSDPVFDSVTTTQLNVQNIAFTGTGAVNIGSGNDLNLTATGNITFNGQTLKPVATSGSYNDLTDKPTTNSVFENITLTGSVTNPNHAATKSYVDSQLNSLPEPTWNSLVNISNEFGPTRIALGRNAGGSSDSDGYGGYGGYGAYGGSSYAIAIGNSSGKTNQGGAAIGIGVATGYTNQGESAIAIGLTAGNVYQGVAAIAVGESAGNSNQGANAVAIGNTAGYTSQGTNAIAIGKNAGRTNQPAGSIVINASGNILDGSAAGFYVDPIRSATATDYVTYYNPTTKEVTYGPAPTGGGGTDPTFDSVTATDLNVQNVTFTGTGAVTITSGNDLNLVAAGAIRFNGELLATLSHLQQEIKKMSKPTDFITSRQVVLRDTDGSDNSATITLNSETEVVEIFNYETNDEIALLWSWSSPISQSSSSIVNTTPGVMVFRSTGSMTPPADTSRFIKVNGNTLYMKAGESQTIMIYEWKY